VLIAAVLVLFLIGACVFAVGLVLIVMSTCGRKGGWWIGIHSKPAISSP
jgi:hypothetical protein